MRVKYSVIRLDGCENTYTDFVSDGVGRIGTAYYGGKCLISYSDLVDYTLKSS